MPGCSRHRGCQGHKARRSRLTSMEVKTDSSIRQESRLEKERGDEVTEDGGTPERASAAGGRPF